MRKITLLLVCILGLLFLVACGSETSESPDTSLGANKAFGNDEKYSAASATNTEEAASPSSISNATTSIQNISSYAGNWFTENESVNKCADDVYQNGGLVLQIKDIREGYIRFRVECISAPPGNRVAEASVETEFKGEAVDFVFKDSWDNIGAGKLELQKESISLTIISYESADADWGIPSEGKFVFSRDNFKTANTSVSQKTIESPTKGNYRSYLEQFDLTGYKADEVIMLNNLLIENNITDRVEIKRIRDAYDLPDEVKLLDELIPINNGNKDENEASTVTSQNVEQIDSRIVGCWFGYNINKERFAYRFDNTGKVTIAYVDQVFYGTTRYTTIDGLLFIESLQNEGAKEYAYSFDDKGLILGRVDLDGENAKAFESISEEKFNDLLKLIDKFKKK